VTEDGGMVKLQAAKATAYTDTDTRRNNTNMGQVPISARHAPAR